MLPNLLGLYTLYPMLPHIIPFTLCFHTSLAHKALYCTLCFHTQDPLPYASFTHTQDPLPYASFTLCFYKHKTVYSIRLNYIMCTISQDSGGSTYPLLPHEPDLESIIEPSTLDTLVPRIITDTVAELVLLEEIWSPRGVALLQDSLVPGEEGWALQGDVQGLVGVPTHGISPEDCTGGFGGEERQVKQDSL